MRVKGKWVLANTSSVKENLLVCPLCSTTISKNDTIAVLAFPITAIDNQGGYNYLPDFVRNEKIVHYACLPANLTNISSDRTYETPKFRTVSDLADELRSALEAIGEYVSQRILEEFVTQNSGRDIHGLISLWFTNRSTFG
jgi:hypothetical protein